MIWWLAQAFIFICWVLILLIGAAVWPQPSCGQRSSIDVSTSQRSWSGES